MVKKRLSLRNVAAIAACLAVTLMFVSCKKDKDKDLNGTVTISPAADVYTGTELTAAYSGAETVTWQWNKDGTAVSGATNAKYTPTEAGSYTATASAPGFNSKTSAAVEVKTVSAVLLETIQFGSELWVYEYDSQNRIAKISYGSTYNEDIDRVETHYYNSAGDLVEVKVEYTSYPEDNYSTTFSKSGNKITSTEVHEGYWSEYTEFELNAQGLPEKVKSTRENEGGGGWIVTNIYTWEDGNLTKILEDIEGECLFTYDDKKSPYYYCQTPKWYLMWWLGYNYKGENNVETETWDGGTPRTYDYTYLNGEGFPLTRTFGSTATFTYIKK